MKPIPTVAAVLAVGLSCQPLAAQQRTSGTSGPQDVCARLVAFVQDQGDRVRGTGERITLRQVRRYARIHDRFACRSAVANLYRAGVIIPPTLQREAGIRTGGRPPSSLRFSGPHARGQSPARSQ